MRLFLMIGTAGLVATLAGVACQSQRGFNQDQVDHSAGDEATLVAFGKMMESEQGFLEKNGPISENRHPVSEDSERRRIVG